MSGRDLTSRFLWGKCQRARTDTFIYGDIFAITCIKTLAVFLVISVYYGTGIV